MILYELNFCIYFKHDLVHENILFFSTLEQAQIARKELEEACNKLNIHKFNHSIRQNTVDQILKSRYTNILG